MDILFIKNLVVITFIGIHDWEKLIKQKIILDIEISKKNYISLVNKNCKKYWDYTIISKKIINYLENNKFCLIEQIADKITSLILNFILCDWVRVKVSKPNAILQAQEVFVITKKYTL